MMFPQPAILHFRNSKCMSVKSSSLPPFHSRSFFTVEVCMSPKKDKQPNWMAKSNTFSVKYLRISLSLTADGCNFRTFHQSWSTPAHEMLNCWTSLLWQQGHLLWDSANLTKDVLCRMYSAVIMSCYMMKPNIKGNNCALFWQMHWITHSCLIWKCITHCLFYNALLWKGLLLTYPIIF